MTETFDSIKTKRIMAMGGDPIVWKLTTDHEVVPATMDEWTEFMHEPANRRVALDNLPHDVVVSTVFLGIDHGFGAPGPPIVFETMVFGGRRTGAQKRYTSWSQAQAGHRRIVRSLQQGRSVTDDFGE